MYLWPMSIPAPSFQPWHISVDTGGTFTDCLAVSPFGSKLRLKVLSSGVLRGKVRRSIGPNQYQIDIQWPVHVDIFAGYTFRLTQHPNQTFEVLALDPGVQVVTLASKLPLGYANQGFEISAQEEAPILAARLATGTPLDSPLPQVRFRLGSTKGTNALLERKGAPLCFLVTQGFGDMLRIGLQQRPDLFSLHIMQEPPLYTQVIEVPERLSAQGEVIQELTPESLTGIVNQLKADGIENVAICLLHSYQFPTHEKELKTALKRAGIRYQSVSHELSRNIQYVARAQTTVVNGYLTPILDNYLRGIRKVLDQQPLHIMTSAGGLVGESLFFPKDSLLSGPAGGLQGAAALAQSKGRERVLTFDMGGTSTDVARFAGQFDYQYETKVGQAHIQSPSLAIETVAAGGGSICSFDGFRLTVGPESAGADPGPACYGAGGPLTVTDVNLLLGKLDPIAFGIPIYLEKAQQALEALRSTIPKPPSAQNLLEGLEHLANQKMADAVRKISVERGFHPKDYSLVAFGGAGGQHACALASLLDIAEVLVPYDAGLLSAVGIAGTALQRFAERQVLQPWLSIADEWNHWLLDVIQEAQQALVAEGITVDQQEKPEVRVFLRLLGQETPLEIQFQPGMDVPSSFRQMYQQLYGHEQPDRPLEVASVRVITRQENTPNFESSASFRSHRPSQLHEISPRFSGQDTHPVFDWDSMQPGAIISGPSVVTSTTQTLFVPGGWQAVLDGAKDAQLSPVLDDPIDLKDARQQPESLLLALRTSRLTALASEMGSLLQRTSFSVNIKERMDFSCALLDTEGRLLVNAPHIPVHLGSLGVCLRATRAEVDMLPGDVILVNHPAFGGSHLPDITLLAPAHAPDGSLLGYVANRAHHAEIGGKAPGSMPADATSLREEGVIFRPTHLVKQGQAQWDTVAKALQAAPYPSRSYSENMADLRGALAAIQYGVTGLQKLATSWGKVSLRQGMEAIYEHAARRMKQALLALPSGPWQHTTTLDDGHQLQVQIHRPTPDQLIIDFTGTSQQHPSNLNANRAIVNSVVLYVLRLLVGETLPLNEGLLANVTVIIPEGSLLQPVFGPNENQNPAVVGGNTEISQRLTDLLIQALGLGAASQGTMNNTLFGNDSFGYYETIGGGTGAGRYGQGANAVHQHMTNTRITDPEVLEHRYPVRLHRWSIREHSGGRGAQPGGNGMIREMEFLAPVTLTVLTQHRTASPTGWAGGQAGKPGRQQVVRANGTQEYLSSTDSRQLVAGDRLLMETPGGGGFGIPSDTDLSP